MDHIGLTYCFLHSGIGKLCTDIGYTVINVNKIRLFSNKCKTRHSLQSSEPHMIKNKNIKDNIGQTSAFCDLILRIQA